MEGATFRGGRDKIQNVTFNGCSLTGNKPLVFEGTVHKDSRGQAMGGDFGMIILKKCEIHSKGSKEALCSISSSVEGDVDELVLDNCKIIVDNGTSGRTVASEFFKGKVTEKNTKKIIRK